MRITWDDQQRFYARGVSMGVLYPQNSPGVPWSGLISVTEKGDDASTPLYLDGIKFRDRVTPSSFAGTISAFTYPDEFEPYNGVISGVTGQPRPPFGFSYRTNRELHLVYNATAGPSNDQYSSMGGDLAPVAFSWDFTTMPVAVPSARATSHLVLALDFMDSAVISALEDMIYGDTGDDPMLPDPGDILTLVESFASLIITDNEDGTWTAEGDETIITFLDADTFQIDWPSAIFIDADNYRIYSL
jgi:hypothetical protein